MHVHSSPDAFFVVEKHARLVLYRLFTEAIALMIRDLLAKVLTSVGFNLVLCFMTNLRREYQLLL